MNDLQSQLAELRQRLDSLDAYYQTILETLSDLIIEGAERIERLESRRPPALSGRN